MKILQWSETFNTGIREIDDQHRKLFELANQVSAILQDAHPPSDRMEVQLCDLVDYTNYHFLTEEELLKNAGYEETDSHIRNHDNLRIEAALFLSRFQQGDNILPELLEFLNHWLVHHIQGADQAYVATVKKHLALP